MSAPLASRWSSRDWAGPARCISRRRRSASLRWGGWSSEGFDFFVEINISLIKLKIWAQAKKVVEPCKFSQKFYWPIFFWTGARQRSQRVRNCGAQHCALHFWLRWHQTDHCLSAVWRIPETVFFTLFFKNYSLFFSIFFIEIFLSFFNNRLVFVNQTSTNFKIFS